MRGLNNVQLVGSVVASPDIKLTTRGKKVAHFHVETVKEWKGATGETKTQPMRHNVESWDHAERSGLASMVEAHVTAGTYVLVEGAIEYEQYTSKAHNVPMMSTKILAKRIIILSHDATDARDLDFADSPYAAPPSDAG